VSAEDVLECARAGLCRPEMQVKCSCQP
jgi:hypothetical protein